MRISAYVGTLVILCLPNRLHVGRISWGKGAHGPTGQRILSALSPVAAPIIAGLDAHPSRGFCGLCRGQDILPTGELAGANLLDGGGNTDPVSGF